MRLIRMRHVSASFGAVSMLLACQTTVPDVGIGARYAADVDTACALVRTSYAYFDARAAYWDEACASAHARALAATTGREGMGALEQLVDDMFDNHASLNSNTGVSPYLVPSGADMWIEEVGVDIVVTGVRHNGAADLAGVCAGDVVTSINGLSPREAAMTRVASGKGMMPPERMAWALNAAAAGLRGDEREIGLVRAGKAFGVRLGPPPPGRADELLTYRMVDGVGVIRFNDSLGDTDTVAAFDAALEAMRGAKGWILDLRDTPSGGSTDVAEPMLGRFVAKSVVYQLTVPLKGAVEPKSIMPRGPWRAEGPVVAIGGRWTGSMGEGMVMGVDASGIGVSVGTAMAGLAGGVEGFDLPQEDLAIRFPAYRLSHPDGTPRERWRPPILAPSDPGGPNDTALAKAFAIVASHVK